MRSPRYDTLLYTLQARFEGHPQRHAGIAWRDVLARFDGNLSALNSLQAMEETGGEPDVTGRDDDGHIVFCDCSAETPAGRRSLCYDDDALAARKTQKPAGSAMAMATGMGVALLTEAQYHALQVLGEFDLKTSSWLATPADVRGLDGALFGDRRYGRVFVYHNGAQSYYAARGFRGALTV